MRVNSVLIGAVGMSLLVGTPARTARADCESSSDQIRPIVDQLPDSRKKTLIEYDFARIEQEIGEFDETECLMALDHAMHLLAQAEAEVQQHPPPAKQP